MAGMIPLSDATRQPRRFSAVTTTSIIANVAVFLLELMGGGEGLVKQWSVIPEQSPRRFEQLVLAAV